MGPGCWQSRAFRRHALALFGQQAMNALLLHLSKPRADAAAGVKPCAHSVMPAEREAGEPVPKGYKLNGRKCAGPAPASAVGT